MPRTPRSHPFRSRPRDRRRRWALLPAAALVLAGCGGTTGSGAGAPTTPRAGGTLTFAVGSDAGCVDPQQVGSNDTIYSLRQIVDSLTDQDPRTGRIVPWLARDWQVSPDATTFTFRLRPGVTFSDGSPLTAQVVKDNVEAIPRLGALATLAKGYLSGLKAVTVLDPLTVRIAFTRPNAQFLQATSTFSLGIESAASVRKTPEERCSEGVVASGPFVLSRYVRSQSITLTKRPGYGWGSSLWRKPGEAYLDQLVFKVVPESGVRTGSLRSGQVDAIGSVGRADEAGLRGGGVTLLARANPGVVFSLGLNNSRPVLADLRVRRAILAAVDRRQVADTVFPTGTRPATSILSHTTPLHTDLGADLAVDPGRARALLDAAGWTPGPDGVRQKGGTPLRITVSWFANAATNQPALELVQQQLRAVGVDVVLKQLQIAQITQVQQSGDFDALWGNLTRADPDILRTQYSTQLLNAYRIPASPLDSVLARAAATTAPAARQQLVTQAQQLIVRNAYVVPVVELQTTLGVSARVHDLAFEASSRIQLHDTWIG